MKLLTTDVSFYKNRFSVTLDDNDLTSFVSSIRFNSLSKTGVITMFVNENVVNWLASLKWSDSRQRMQPINMNFIICSTDISHNITVYDGKISITDIIYNCDCNDDSMLTVDITFETNSRRIMNS